jgi:hypothetical protein
LLAQCRQSGLVKKAEPLRQEEMSLDFGEGAIRNREMMEELTRASAAFAFCDVCRHRDRRSSRLGRKAVYLFPRS